MENIAKPLLAWFAKHQRVLPFRTDPSPYHVWLSEIMLQQTRVSAVLPYYERFLTALPTIEALAACDEEALHKLWEGLGYYSRVRNLQKAAKIVCAEYNGQLPGDYDALLSLPGIGTYTAGAIASISFGLPVPAVDGNVLRVFARLYNDDRLITDPQVKKEFTERVMAHLPPENPSAYNQALMELGALVCVPNGAPHCADCPLTTLCKGYASGEPQRLPQKPMKKPRKIVPVTVALVHSEKGWLIQQRPPKGLLAGLWQPPLYEEERFASAQALQEVLAMKGIGKNAVQAVLSNAPFAKELPKAKHIFTHIEWHLEGWMWEVEADTCILPEGWVFASEEELRTVYTLPNAFAKYKPLMQA